MEYVKLANVTTMVSGGELTKAALLEAVTAEETRVVNLKGRILTAAQVAAHLAGSLDGEEVVRT